MIIQVSVTLSKTAVGGEQGLDNLCSLWFW